MVSRLPAYAAPLAAARRAGQVPANGEVILAVDLWDVGRPRGSRARCLVPPDLPADNVRLDFLAGLDVLLAWNSAVTAPARVTQLAHAVLAVNPRRLLCLDLLPSAAHCARWVRSVARGDEV